MKKDFENYLREIHMLLNPEVLDDDLPNHFDNWVADLQADDFIKYANQWGIELLQHVKEVLHESARS